MASLETHRKTFRSAKHVIYLQVVPADVHKQACFLRELPN